MSVTILDHPLILHKLALLRDRRTGVKEFRELVREIASLMCYEATRNLVLEDGTVETPVGIAKVKTLTGKKIAIVPILRAGLGMAEGILDLIPAAKVAHIGLYRDPETLEPVEYYCKMPPDIASREVIVLDPMLATGGTACQAVQFLKNYGVSQICMLCLLASPEGLERLTKEHPDITLYTCAVDERIDEHGYIIPGLGDAGDRIFGTK